MIIRMSKSASTIQLPTMKLKPTMTPANVTHWGLREILYNPLVAGSPLGVRLNVCRE